MANYNLEKIINEFKKADIKEKEQAIGALTDLLSVEFMEKEAKLRQELELVQLKIKKLNAELPEEFRV